MIATWKKVLIGLSIPWGLASTIGAQLLVGSFTVNVLLVDLVGTAAAIVIYIWFLLRLRGE